MACPYHRPTVPNSFLDFYVSGYRAEPLAIAVLDDEEVRTGNVAAPLHAGNDPPDVGVSLCRIAAADLQTASAEY